MLDARGQTRLTLGFLVVVLAGVLAWLWWMCACRPDVRFLPAEGPAEWIVYPAPPWPNGRPIAEQRAIFHRTFTLERVPGAIQLRVRGFTEAMVRVNDSPVELPRSVSGHGWKDAAVVDVSGQLRPGANDIAVVVANASAPPALWLVLSGQDWSLHTDGDWEVSLDGAVPQPARLARTPPVFGPGNLLSGGERPLQSFQARWPTLLLFAALSATALVVYRLIRRRPPKSRIVGFLLTPEGALAVLAIFWVALFFNNLGALPYAVGFDFESHLAYMQYIQTRGSLPLANEGIEMHQAPLYYLLGSAALSACGLSAADPGAYIVLRLLSLVTVLANCTLLLACLRLIVPTRPGLQIAGLILGGCLPAQLYLAHYPTNELLFGALGTAAVYLALRVLRDQQPSALRHLALGACLGAALLTKVTAVVPALVVFIVLTGRLAVRGERRPGVWLRTVGVAGGACLLVCGWHYARVAARFGTPLVGSFDPASGFAWWQEPGYATCDYLWRLGGSLTEPFFSGLGGFLDGLYSTLWGDALWGGSAGRAGRPPWAYDLMAAGYLLALVPTLTIVIGFAAGLVRLVRRPSAEGFLLVGLVISLGVAMVYHFLRYPYQSHVRGFYALCGLAALAAFGSQGFDLVTRRRLPAQFAAAILLGTWAVTAYLSFWVSPDAPETQAWIARHLRDRGRVAEAAGYLRGALVVHPGDPRLLRTYGDLLFGLGEIQAGRQQLQLALDSDPADAGAHLTMSLIYERDGQRAQALAEVRRAAEAAPEDTRVWPALARLLAEDGQTEAAVAALRHGLGVAPYDGRLQQELGKVLAKGGRIEEALAALQTAARLQPGNPAAVNQLAWALATTRDDRLRDAAEALRLSESLCEASGYGNPVFLDTLAAACAAVGQFDRAAALAARATTLAAGAGDDSLARSIEGRGALYRSGQAYRE